jgi:hypothetical protein
MKRIYLSFLLLTSFFWVKNLWAQEVKASMIVTQTPAVQIFPAQSHASTPSMTLVPTITSTPVVTLTPIPTPTSKSIYFVLGDSWVAGNGTSRIGTPMWALTLAGLSLWYPQIQYEYKIIPGSRPLDWVQILPNLLADYTKKGTSIGYAILITGRAEFLFSNKVDLPDCTKGATLSQGVSYSYIFQKDLSNAIGVIYEANPDIHLVVTTVADSYGGKDNITLAGIYEAYTQRLYELQTKYPKMRIANIEQAMYGHPEYFCPLGDPEYTHPNDLGQVIMALTILEQFANWPYIPAK